VPPQFRIEPFNKRAIMASSRVVTAEQYLDDLPLEVIGEAIASIPPERFIDLYETSRSGASRG
jgi:hypothetical protein